MGNEWKEITFPEAVLINPKVDLKKGVEYPFVEMKAIEPTWKNVSESEIREFKNGGSRFLPNDTLLARITPCLENGKTARFAPSLKYAGKPGFGSTEFIVIRGREGVTDNDFAYYLSQYPEFREYAIAQMTGSSGRQRVPVNSLNSFSFLLPPLNEQKAIANILGSLDDKIELNRRINETLEAIARAIFKSWFVDFDPVRAKAEGRDTGLPDEIADLFPDSFTDSELGKIPEGWEVVSFGSLIQKTIGGDWGKKSPDNVHNIKSKIIRGTDIPELLNGSISKAPLRFVKQNKLKTRKLTDGDIIIEISGGSPTKPTGRSLYITNNLIERLGGIVEPASFCRMFKPVSNTIGLFVAIHLIYIYNQGKMWGYQNQSTGIANFQKNMFLERENLAIPNNRRIFDFFYNKCRPIIDKIQSNENVLLSKIRDTLLPKLISGELRVNDVEEIVEEE